jgi:hypothetical protein
MLTSWTVFSQTGTIIKEETKCFPIGIVKRIAQDLLRGDSAINELRLTNLELSELEKKILLKDNIILTHQEKEKNYIKVIDLERQKFETMENFNNSLQFELKKQKIKSKITSISSISLGVILLGAIFFK